MSYHTDLRVELCWTTDYMLHHLQIEESQIPEMSLELYKEYGTTIAGLKVWTSTWSRSMSN